METLGPSDPIEDDSTKELVAQLRVIFRDVRLYRRLLKCEGANVQKVLDTFQWLLDLPHVDNFVRRNLVVATQRLSKKTGLYPVCYRVENIVQEDQYPLTTGGYADIYKGQFEGHPVALKAIRVYQTTEIESFLRSVSNEVIIWGQLSHPNILPFYGVYHFQNRISFVAPWMEAGDVTQYLKKNPNVDRVLLAVDVARGLQYLHENGIIHGDLKGPNVLIDNGGRARLADFGLSSISDPEILAWTSHSSAASKGGSYRWQAPELFDVESDTTVKNSKASDVYAMACVCYEIFAGAVPFKNLQYFTITLRVKSGSRPARPPPQSLSWREWGLTEAIWTLIEECWSQNPEDRPSVELALKGLEDDGLDDQYHETEVLLPSHFRRKVARPIDVLDATTLDLIMEANVAGQTTPHGDHESVSEESLVDISSFDQQKLMDSKQISTITESPLLESVFKDLTDRLEDRKNMPNSGRLLLSDSLTIIQGEKVREFTVYLFESSMIMCSEIDVGLFKRRARLRMKGRIHLKHINRITEAKTSRFGLMFHLNINMDPFCLVLNNYSSMLIWKAKLETLIHEAKMIEPTPVPKVESPPDDVPSAIATIPAEPSGRATQGNTTQRETNQENLVERFTRLIGKRWK
ncbi:hypothetical protein H0H93_006091 [Arthromyces matolae]|nr:hypothetical protein H0H93_006091 [Arthromyces matolae]